MPVCFLKRERMAMDPDGREDGEELGRAGGEDTMQN